MIADLLTRRPLLASLVGALVSLCLILWVVTEIAAYPAAGSAHYLLVIVILSVVNVTVIMLAVSLLARNRRLQAELKGAAGRRIETEEITLAAAGLAHETKNPLGIIRGLAQQIADDEANSPRARQKARQIVDEADVTTARLGDFIRYARVRDPKFAVIDAVPYFNDLCDLVRDDFESNDVTLKVSVLDLKILGDPEMLSQVVLNLLNNSQRFTEPGGKVTVGLRPDFRSGKAMLVVEDSGTGIPAEFLPYVFKPYMKKSRAGYGLGLAIVKRIVERCGWDIGVKSEEGQGTEITISGIDIVE